MQKKYKPFVSNPVDVPPAEPVNEEVPQETMELLNQYKQQFTKQVSHGQSRKTRLEALMIRPTMGGGPKKRRLERAQKLIRRHTAAVNQIDSAQKVLDQVEVRISQITHSPA